MEIKFLFKHCEYLCDLLALTVLPTWQRKKSSILQRSFVGNFPFVDPTRKIT